MLKDLFPAQVATVRAEPSMYEAPLLPEEARALSPKAVEKRRREFIAGRVSARQAIARLGVEPVAILPDSDRAPIWPEGVVGSISHCPGYCGAVAGLAKDFQSLGLDVEQVEPLKPDLIRLIMTPNERIKTAPRVEGMMDIGKLTFSAKEAFYKAYYPLAIAEVLQRGNVPPEDVMKVVFLGFLDVELDIEPAAQRFVARIINPDKPSFAGRREIEGFFRFDEKWVYSGVTVFKT